MFKVIGMIATLAIGAGAVAVWMGDLDFQASAKLTAKGQQQLQEFRNKVAEQIRDGGK